MRSIKYFVLGFLLVGFFANNLWSTVTGEESSRLSKEAEIAQAKAAAAELIKPVAQEGAKWKYFVERTIETRQNDKKKVDIDRAFVHFGAGAKQAGGQIKNVPHIVYVDENQKRLAKAVHQGPAITTINSEMLTLTGDLPKDKDSDPNMGSDPNLPVGVFILINSFFLPLEPKGKLEEGIRWSSILHARFGWGTNLTFPVTIKHELKGYEQKQGIECAVIEYTIAGEFKYADYPERFTEEELLESKGAFSLKGNGTVYLKAGIIVEKEQTVSWKSLEERLRRLGNGDVGWVPAVDQEQAVKVRVSLQSGGVGIQDGSLDKNKSKSMAESPEENYFSTWLQLREKRRFDKIKGFLKELTEEENVVAVKQTYSWLIEQERQSSDKEYEGMEGLAIRDFADNYFKGYPDRNPKPFLEMIEDHSLDNRFRLMLIKCLDRAYGGERAFFQAVFDSLIKMISNANEPLELCQQAKSTISRLLGRQRRRVRMSQDELNRLSVKELLSFPKEKVSPETEKRIKVLADNYNRYFWAVLSLSARDLTLYDRLFYSVELSEQKKDGFVTDPALVEALDNTVKKLTLSKEEFIEGAKQANEWISKQKRQKKEPGEHGWGETVLYTAGGFVQYYFRRFPEEGPKPFLEMASDKNNDEDFREAMLSMLGHGSIYALKQDHLTTFSSSLISVAGDEENSILIRKEALDCLQQQLARVKTAEKEQLLQKINVTRDKYVQTLLCMLNESDLEPRLMRHVLRDLNASLKKPTESAPQIREALGNAVRNYHKFNDEHWRHLAGIGLKTLNLPDANDLLESIVEDIDKIIAVQQEGEKKRRLESDRKIINVTFLGNLSKQMRKQLVINLGIAEEALVEANRILANPKGVGNRLYWETRAKDLERQLKELKEILRRGKVRYLKGIPEQEPKSKSTTSKTQY